MTPVLHPAEVSSKRWEYIRQGGSFVFRVQSVYEAIACAKKMRDDGIRDLFRGQTNSEWKVTSSFERQPSGLATAAKRKLGQFVGWAKSNPRMARYNADEDSLVAIAQHYGLATTFIDFTSDPEVAAFFALDTKREPSAGQLASIICLNEADFSQFWTQNADVICGVANARKPEILRINVDNLWRLQAQKGCFLWSSVRELEEWYDFDRIVFPFENVHELEVRRSHIYPENQSALELEIAHFFMNERMGATMIALQELATSAGLPIEEIDGDYDVRCWYPAGLPRSPDWDKLDHWLNTNSEHVHAILESEPLEFCKALSAKEFSDNLLKIINEDYIAQHRTHGLVFSWGNHDPEDTEVLRLASCIRLLWNGVRRLPYSNAEVQGAVESAVRMFFSREYDQSILTVIGLKHVESKPVFVEFSVNADGRGSYSRAYVSRDGLAKALSPHFVSAVTEVQSSFPAKIEEVLLIPARPWERFTFEGLRVLMISEIVPSQAILYGGRDSNETLHRAFCFSPADIKIFGLV